MMEKVIKKGVSIILIYALLMIFTFYMMNRIERLNAFQEKENSCISFYR